VGSGRVMTGMKWRSASAGGRMSLKPPSRNQRPWTTFSRRVPVQSSYTVDYVRQIRKGRFMRLPARAGGSLRSRPSSRRNAWHRATASKRRTACKAPASTGRRSPSGKNPATGRKQSPFHVVLVECESGRLLRKGDRLVRGLPEVGSEHGRFRQVLRPSCEAQLRIGLAPENRRQRGFRRQTSDLAKCSNMIGTSLFECELLWREASDVRSVVRSNRVYYTARREVALGLGDSAD
jgi:hypothetical protein